MIEKKQDRYCYVLDNGKPTVYDLNKKDILQMHQVEDLLNNLYEENEQLKSILFDTVERLKVRINPNEDTVYAVTLVVDGEMYYKIKEIIT